MPLRRHLLRAALAVAVPAATAFGGGQHRPYCPPAAVPVCPPTPGVPVPDAAPAPSVDPGVPGTTVPAPQPAPADGGRATPAPPAPSPVADVPDAPAFDQPPAAAQLPQAPSASAQQLLAGSGVGAAAFGGAVVPSMLGDFFGTANSTAVIPGLVTTVRVEQTGLVTTSGNAITYSAPTVTRDGNPLGLSGSPLTFTTPQGSFNVPGSTPLNENSAVTAAVNADLASSGGASSAGGSGSDATAVFADSRQVFQDGPEFATATYVAGQTVIAIPSPSASGFVVGRQKIAENSSPIPRDRVFFNYSYFDDVPLSADGTAVNRFTPGFEKTFADGLMSVEARFPFATTLSTDIVAGGATNDGELEFGNIFVSLKALLYTTDQFALAAGLGISAPTGDGITVSATNGTRLIEVDNDSVHLLPYVGAAYVPNKRVFFQGFAQLDYDVNGNGVRFGDGNGGLVDAGTIDDVTFLYLDAAAGFWAYRARRGTIRGFAPIAELHFSRSLQETDVVAANTGLGPLAAGNFAEDIQVLNGLIGSQTQLGDDAMLAVGYGFPIGNNADRVFDGELRVTLNWFPSRRGLGDGVRDAFNGIGL